MLRIFHNTGYHFIRHWKKAAVLTVAFIILGAAAFIIKPQINYSIEFTGGTLMQVDFHKPPNISEIRSALDASGFRNAEIQQFGADTEFTIRARSAELSGAQANGATGVARQIQAVLNQHFTDNQPRILRTEAVGPRVGAELRRGALLAILISFGITLVYLAIRFEWRFGVAAVVATMHDILTTMAFLKLMNLEVSLTVVAGILTVIGYSLNDTIIIFDRVRENIRRGRKESLYDTLDRSINETLPRSILTHATTAAATLALILFAGEVIRPFALVMFFGIVTGTFSSIYVASPILLWIEQKWPRANPIGGGSGKGGTSSQSNAAKRPAPTMAAR